MVGSANNFAILLRLDWEGGLVFSSDRHQSRPDAPTLDCEGAKFIGGDSYDDDDRKALDDSSRLIKEAVFGDSESLNDTVSSILDD